MSDCYYCGSDDVVCRDCGRLQDETASDIQIQTAEKKLAIALEALKDIEWSDECASNVAAEAIKKINGNESN